MKCQCIQKVKYKPGLENTEEEERGRKNGEEKEEERRGRKKKKEEGEDGQEEKEIILRPRSFKSDVFADFFFSTDLTSEFLSEVCVCWGAIL